MSTEPVAIVMAPRDRFSPTAPCLRRVFETTPGAGEIHPVHCIVGGAPEHLRRAWTEEFGGRVHFEFPDEFLNQNASRNRVLERLDTRLAVVLDNDTYPRAGWLEAMVACQRDTGATMVTPLILEGRNRIHCAGVDLYKNRIGDREYGHKVLRLTGYPYDDGSNLRRSRVDYGELHLMLVERESCLRLGAFDPEIIEVGEVDCGMVWDQAGLEMWFEPDAVVHFALHGATTVDDIDFYLWRWDAERVLAGYRRFEDKWGFDITEQGQFEHFVVDYRSHIPLLARRFRSPAVLRAGQAWYGAFDWLLRLPPRVRNAVRRRVHGGGEHAIVPDQRTGAR